MNECSSLFREMWRVPVIGTIDKMDSDCPKNLALVFHPVRSKTKTNYTMYA